MGLESHFPRTASLPPQSPLFWVTHKDRYLRQLLIHDIEESTGRDLLVYFTDSDNSSASIDPGDDQYLVELLNNRKRKPVDLLLETPGGSTDATEKICSLLRALAPDLRVIVPRRAKSNGTVIALTGSSIVLSASSELGPIDPSVANIPAEFVLKDRDKYNVTLVRYAESASAQTKKLATMLLATGMMKGTDAAKIEAVVQKLATRDQYASHGSVIDAREAKELGLAVEELPSDDEFAKKLWLLRTMYAYDCAHAGYAKLFESSRISTATAAKPPPPAA